MYGPIAAGPYGACQEVYPRPLRDDGLCDCGRPKEPGDWLCRDCRRALEIEEAMNKGATTPDERCGTCRWFRAFGSDPRFGWCRYWQRRPTRVMASDGCWAWTPREEGDGDK